MSGSISIVFVAFAMVVSGAPPAQQSTYQQVPQHGPAHLQQVNALDYYLANQENYYRPAEQRQVSNNHNEQSGRLETLEPDSEVEQVPGVQPPQQPPQQNPVAPNIPGLLPGQRVFIVHMPVPGYRPGTIGGYQPVYIVAAGAQGNPGYPGNGFQNAVLLDASGQPMVSPFVGYGARGIVPPQLLGTPLQVQRPYDLVYQDPGLSNAGVPALHGDAGREAIRFSNAVGLQGPINPAAFQGPVVAIQGQTSNMQVAQQQLQQQQEQQQQQQPQQRQQQQQPIEETKETVEQKPSYRGSPALLRNKA